MTRNIDHYRPEFAACTVIAKNYLPMARVLAESWAKFHPDCPFFVLLLDSPNGFFSPEGETFQSVFPSELAIPNLDGFLFKYTVLEASTAVKPYFFSHLFRRYRPRKLLYLDPDILILHSLNQLSAYLDEFNVLLTPHLLSPLPDDGQRQNEHDILKSGVYNLGFLGLREGLESEQLLRWWSAKLYHHCMVAVESNLFVDQRWMDLAPSLFEGVRILREPGYNVAYWNLHERFVSVDDAITVNSGDPLYFFHFSGFDADKPWIVSKHQNRLGMTDIGDTVKLYCRYRDMLVDKGWNDTKGWRYGYDFFNNGVQIPPSVRRYYWSLGTDVMHLGNPFSWLGNGFEKTTIEKLQPHGQAELPNGINLVGHFQSVTGVGEGVRSNLRIIQSTGIPYAVTNRVDPNSHNVEQVPERPASNTPFRTNLITINADALPLFAEEHAASIKDHFNIGYWTWELPEFPAEWARSFGYVDEIWTPSEFTRNAIAACSPVPVKIVPYSMDPKFTVEDSEGSRPKFGLSPETFVFLFFFDFHSYLERKNPLGLIDAFKRAFGRRRDVQLLIKSIHGSEHSDELAAVQRACQGGNILLIDCVLTRAAKHELMRIADCYVSLHRSEGFGLTLAEAMLCGKPVIATGYSGNVDFMSEDDSFLVPYRVVSIDRTCGPYKAGYHWADPDLDYAADAMREVESRREAAMKRGQTAQRKVHDLLHPATIERRVRERLEELGLAHRVSARHLLR